MKSIFNYISTFEEYAWNYWILEKILFPFTNGDLPIFTNNFLVPAENDAARLKRGYLTSSYGTSGIGYPGLHEGYGYYGSNLGYGGFPGGYSGHSGYSGYEDYGHLGYGDHYGGYPGYHGGFHIYKK